MSSHLKEFLDYYKNLTNPGYAVLVTGEWGAGKTHQVTKVALKEHEYYYVSLFGITKAEEIHAELFAKSSPFKNATQNFFSKFKDIKLPPGYLNLPVGIALNSITNVLIKKKISNDRILIFDDLERCSMNKNDLLGVVNNYMEQHEFRTIVISNDSQISGDIINQREKVFGKIINIEPNASEAFDAFLFQINKNLKNIGERKLNLMLRDNRDLVIAAFYATETKSLRVLRGVIEDLSRVAEFITENQLKNKLAMRELIETISALDMLKRCQKIDSSDIEARRPVTVLSPSIKDCMKQLRLTMPNALTSTIIDNQTLSEIIVKGVFNREKIIGAISSSTYFSPEKPRFWSIIEKMEDYSDDDVQSAIDTANRAFDNRDISKTGDMLRLFSTMFLLKRLGLIQKDYEEIKRNCLSYIDSIFNLGKIEPAYSKINSRSVSANSGSTEMDEYNRMLYEVENALNNKRLEFSTIEGRQVSISILEMLKSKPEEFFEKLTVRVDNPDIYSTPILSKIGAKEFVEAWTSIDSKLWEKVAWLLVRRYSNALLSQFREIDSWRHMVIQELKTKCANSSSKLSQARLIKIISLLQQIPDQSGIPT